MLDIKLNSNHDIDISTFDLELIENSEWLAQKIKIVLLFFFAEWFLDTTKGIKYWELIFVANPNLTLIDSIFKTALLEIEEINELLEYDSEFNRTNRSISLEFTVDTNFGVLSTTQEIVL